MKIDIVQSETVDTKAYMMFLHEDDEYGIIHEPYNDEYPVGHAQRDGAIVYDSDEELDIPEEKYIALFRHLVGL